MEDKYSEITYEQYTSLFGLNNPEKKDLHKAALEKAWDTRNFEIDKFWQRSAYFWGFIALIFGGYIAIVTEKSGILSKKMYLDFYLILLGIIFSVAWLLVICGSKRWQENWEKHIEYLEDEITGPLYKTIYHKGNYYYSVSGINQILVCIVILIWGILLIQYIYTNCSIINDIFEYIYDNFKVILLLWLPFIGTIICIVVMLVFGQSFKGNSGAFFVKKKMN